MPDFIWHPDNNTGDFFGFRLLSEVCIGGHIHRKMFFKMRYMEDRVGSVRFKKREGEGILSESI